MPSKKTSFYRFISYLFILFATLLNGMAQAQDFLNPEDAFKLSAQITPSTKNTAESTSSTPSTLQLHFDITPGYYMYRERFEFNRRDNAGKIVPIAASNLQIPLGEMKYDPTFDKEMEVYHHPISLSLPLSPSSEAFTLEVTAQGCADAGLCYPPMYFYIPITPINGGFEISLPKDSQGVSQISYNEASLFEEQQEINTAEPAVSTTSSLSSTHQNNSTTTSTTSSLDILNAGDTDIANWLQNASIWYMIAVAFLLGLALSFTPCVLPMLPILLSLVVGTQHRQSSRFDSIKLTLLYVLGTSIVYTLLGIAAASIGAALANWIQNPWVLSIFALLLVLFGIAMFGAYNMQMPSSVQTGLNNLVNKLPAGKSGGALLMGMISALICGPCVAAPLAGVLLFISQTGNVATGAIILFVLAWGQGASLIILGSSSGALLPKAGMWMETVKKVCGLLLFAAALWMVAPLLPNWLPMILWALLALGFAFVVGTFRGYKPFPRFGNLFIKLLGGVATVWAILLLVGLGIGSRSVLHPLQVQQIGKAHVTFERIQTLAELKTILANTNKPVMLDFYADWCISCVEMEKFTFTDKNVAEKMQEMRLVQVDVTKNTAQDRELLKAFQLFGPPGIIFFNTQGDTVHRVIGFQNAERFLDSLKKVLP